MRTFVLLLLAWGVALLFGELIRAQDHGAQDQVGSVAYEKLNSREATRKAMLERLYPNPVKWGDWFLLSPFPYAGHGRDDLKTVHAPEAELSKMKAGGAGPNLDAVYVGKKGVEARWKPLGQIGNRRVDLHVHQDPQLNDNAACYLYGTVTVPESSADGATLNVTMGSDDGLRFWCNARLLVDKDVPRGLNAESDAVTLDLKPGVNHLLAKVSEGGGSWDYQINVRDPLDPMLEAKLDYLLDRDFPSSPEAEFFRILTLPAPKEIVLEVGGIAIYPDGRPIVTTRRGDIYLVENAYEEPPENVRWVLYAQGLHEPLGVAVRVEEGRPAVYTVQRAELTRLVDEDGDDQADLYETFCDDWGVSGNYHEFSFGPKFDSEGNAWVTLNVGFCGSLGKSTVPWRGWALKVTPQGEAIPVCGGLRSPNGIGANVAGEFFYVDNQGDYVATNRLSWLQQGSWHGHPSSLRWYDGWEDGDAPPPRQPATIWFPYKKMGQSTADVVLEDTGGKFGPYGDQIFVGDQTLATVMRVDLEQIDGFYQGACFPFRAGFASGVNRMAFAPDGSMLVGMTDRGWGSVGKKRYGLQRVLWTGKVPNELLSMRLTTDGFELRFTAPIDAAAAAKPDSYRMTTYTYEYHREYGCPELDSAPRKITAVEVVDPRTVRISVDQLLPNYVHELHLSGIPGLLHETAYYTLQKMK